MSLANRATKMIRKWYHAVLKQSSRHPVSAHHIEALESRVLLSGGTLSGVAYRDVDGNGQFDHTDQKFAEVVVYLDDNDNGQLDWTDLNANTYWDQGEGERWVLTDVDGVYVMNSVEAQDHVVRAQGHLLEATQPGPVPWIDLISYAHGDGTDNTSKPFESMSADGRYVTFSSSDDSLVPSDTNDSYDVFVYDRLLGTLERISLSSLGEQGDADSEDSEISDDGRFVTFSSLATNLVENDTNGFKDVFVHDRLTGQTIRINKMPDGTEGQDDCYAPTISADGQFVAFIAMSDAFDFPANEDYQVAFLYDMKAGEMSFVDLTNDDQVQKQGVGHLSLSGDGSLMAFSSYSPNLVDGDTNSTHDVFVHDFQAGLTKRISVSNEGVQANDSSSSPVISDDGRYVVFQSLAQNLIQGTYDKPGFQIYNVFRYNMQSTQLQLLSVNAAGEPARGNNKKPSISADGRYVVYASNAKNLVEGYQGTKMGVFLYDTIDQTVELVSTLPTGVTNGNAINSHVTADGNVVAFTTDDRDLSDKDNNLSVDTYVYRQEWGVYRINVSEDQMMTDLDFTMQQIPPGSISDYVWFDENADGIQDPQESGFENITVNLLDENQQLLRTTLTDQQGAYQFDLLVPGDYYVQVIAPQAYQFSPVDQGEDDTNDSDMDIQHGLSSRIHVDRDQMIDHVDAGLYQSLSLSGVVWEDLYLDGQRDDDDPLLQGFTVELYDENDNLLQTTTSDANGAYQFSGLRSGSYVVSFPSQADRNYTLYRSGDEQTDSDASPIDGRTELIVLSASQPTDSIDGGFAPAGRIEIDVWWDYFTDGVNHNEPPASGTRFTLSRVDGQRTVTTMVMGNKTIDFNDLAPGDYQLTITPPYGKMLTYQDQGDDDSIDSDFDRTTNTMYLTLTDGQVITDLGAGLMYIPPSRVEIVSGSIRIWMGFRMTVRTVLQM